MWFTLKRSHKGSRFAGTSFLCKSVYVWWRGEVMAENRIVVLLWGDPPNSRHNTGGSFIGQGKIRGLLTGKHQIQLKAELLCQSGSIQETETTQYYTKKWELSRIFTYWRSDSSVPFLFQLLNAGSQAELFRQEIEGSFFADSDSLKGKTYDIENDSKK